MIAWRDTSIAAVKRKEEIAEQEAAEARSGAGEDKMLKKMAKRAGGGRSQEGHRGEEGRSCRC